MNHAPFIVLAVIALAGCGTESPKSSGGSVAGTSTAAANGASTAKPDAGAPAGTAPAPGGW